MARDPASRSMARYADGDGAAFGELYDLVAPRLYAYLLRRTRDADSAQDLLQQTLLVVHRARASYSRAAGVMPWVFTIARRLLIDRARNARRDPLRTDDSGLFALPSTSERADDLVDASELAVRLEAALAELPAPQRLVFGLVKRRGLSLGEAAAVLQISVGAVKLRLHRAQRTLRAALRRRRES